ncbi:hypothetical protein GCM10011607_12050 [Shewanella inventionis]|uniref:Uncharacterized protein n=1 Tax=Shewanella inventionis TaxID=1738770 RepID=A0ABQ1IVF8_9GAMM|nr:hypothetical protein [Shewanella inventionis]GGB53132.1 hypothetical protein GCM10011607_12050 [Shewanella inventionis]
MYYVIQSEYAGANTHDSAGHILGDTTEMTITTTIGLKNMSKEPCTEGWLGTTNDWSSTARGEFNSLEEALGYVHSEGYTEEKEDSECDEISVWVTPESKMEKWNAGDWVLNAMGEESACKEYNITADSTDAHLEAMADKVEKEAKEDFNTLVFGTYDLFCQLRDDLEE